MKVDGRGAGAEASPMTDALPEPAELEALVARAQALPALAPKRALLQRLLQDYARGHGSGAGALVIALVGATGAGKSTLLNALAGAALATEGTDRPTSTRAVVYAPQDADVAALAATGAEVVRYRASAVDPWSGQVFVDTPDLNSVAQAHRELATAALERADVALAVMHKGAVVEAAQVEFLRGFARRRRLLFVLNFADELSEGSREQLKAQVREVALQQLGLPKEEARVYAVSAKAARQGEDPSGEWPLLLAGLRALGRQADIEKVRRSNAMGALRELGSALAPAVASTQAARAEVLAALAASWSQAAASMREDFSGRLERSRGHLRTEVRRAAAGRWWGPAAWWMRLSALGAGGLGGAALVARRNLPIGLAVAAVSTAVDALKDKTLAVSADRRVVSDEDPALAEATSAAVASARAAAHQRGLPPETLGLPSAQALLERLTQLRAAAWEYTEREAVGAVVHRWWRWSRFLLLPLINLPLFALLCHVAYNVVRSYLFGPPYLGLDYFLNASGLAAVLSIAGGLLASVSLLGAAARVRRAALARFDAALAALGAQLREGAGESLAPALAAAQAVVALGA